MTDELVNYIDSGSYNDERKCFQFLSNIKWENGHFCSTCIKRGNSTPADFEVMKFGTNSYRPYSRLCRRCKQYESPTANTLLDGLDIVPLLYLLHFILKQRTIHIRLTNKVLQDLVKGDTTLDNLRFSQEYLNELKTVYGNTSDKTDTIYISASTVEKYRKLLQENVTGWQRSTHYNTIPYGIIKFNLKYGKETRLVYAARQLSPNGHIAARIYDSDTLENLEDFLDRVIPSTQIEIALINWDAGHTKKKPVKYPNISTASFSRKLDGEIDGLIDARFVEGLQNRIESWFVDSKLSFTNERLAQLHLDECIFLGYYNEFKLSDLMRRLVQTPFGGL